MSRWVELGLRAGITIVFLWAGIAKAIDPGAFHREILNYRLGWPALALVVTAYLPWLEIVAAIGLWIAAVSRGATQILLVLTGVFLVAIVSAWARGLDLSCGCFGGSGGGAASYPLWVGRDLLLLAALVTVDWIRHRSPGTGGMAESRNASGTSAPSGPPSR